jgi:ubiquinone/menaquinone biosynthesis C-methylase UbiE
MGKKNNGNGNGNGRSMEGIYSFYSPFYDLIFGKVFEAGRRQAINYLDSSNKKVLEVGIGTGLTLPHYPKGSRRPKIGSEKWGMDSRSIWK